MPPTPATEGNKVSSCAGGSKEKADRPASPPKEEKNKEELVRIGLRFFSKDTSTTRRLNFGVEVGKSPSGIRFKSLNKVVSEKGRTYKPINKRLPACPGLDTTRPVEEK